MERATRPSQAKKRGTDESRKNCFVEFCQDKGLRDPTSDHMPTEESNFILACYAINVIKGDNILGLNLRNSTVRKYVEAVAMLYEDAKLPNPFRADSLAVNYPEVLLQALAKYEKVPSRKETITDQMFDYIRQQASETSDDSLLSALYDWFAWGRYSGPHQSEWCQTRKTKYDIVEQGAPGEARAFVIDGVGFFGENGNPVDPRTSSYALVDRADVCWRWQKNGDNGESIKYYRTRANPRWCPVRALWSIVQRAIRLGVPVHEPIAKYRNTKGNTHFITDFNVKTILQDAAREAMGIKDKITLAKWTCHSLRVTAANELHRLGFSDAFIKHRLRWRSDAFQMYLRHTVHAAKMHTKSISLCDRNLHWGDSNLKEVNARMQGLSSMRPEDNDRVLWSLTAPQA